MSAFSPELAGALNFDIDKLLDIPRLHDSQNQHNVVKFEKVLSDLQQFLTRTLQQLAYVSTQHHEIEWYLANKETIQRIDAIVRRSDTFIESAFGLDINDSTRLLLQNLTVVSVDTTQSLRSTKARCDVAMNYSEIKFHVLDTLRSEIQSCCQTVESIDTSLPWTIPPETELEEVLNCYTKKGTILSAPPTCQPDYTEITALEHRLGPMHFSMTILQHRIEEFQISAKTWFPDVAVKIANEYNALSSDWDSLQQSYSTLKELTTGKRSHSMLSFVLSQTSKMIHELIRTLRLIEASQRNTKVKGTDFKLCSKAISVVEYALKDGKSGHKDLMHIYNEEVIPRWNYLNNLLSDSDKVPEKTAPSGQFRPLKIGRITTPQADVARNSDRLSLSGPLLGLDLRIPVEQSPAVPLSINKFDRIVDLSIDYDIRPISNIQNALMSEGTNDDTDTIHIPHQDFLQCLRPEKQREKSLSNKELLKKLSKEASGPSRIPSIVYNYAELKLPVLKKMFVTGHTPTRIPGISVDNSVFCSPERKSTTPKTPPRYTGQSDLSSVMEDSPEEQLKSPMVLQSPPVLDFSPFQDKRTSFGNTVFGDLTNTVSRQSSYARASKMSLNDIHTPNLAFNTPGTDITTSPMSWRSTSPERPGSSMGSRFDDKHLTRSVKAGKRPWK